MVLMKPQCGSCREGNSAHAWLRPDVCSYGAAYPSYRVSIMVLCQPG